MRFNTDDLDYSGYEFVGLASGEEAHAVAPLTFQIPSREERELVGKHDLFKVMVRLRREGEEHDWVHRMWVEALEDGRFVGKMASHIPVDGAREGDLVWFGPEHVIDILRLGDPDHPLSE